MTPRRRKRHAVAAWLGIVALVIQALIPALLAAEVQLAGGEGGQGPFTLCAFGHLHARSAPDPGGTSGSPQHDEDMGATCPVCIALLASPPFTAPGAVVLPLPAGYPVEALTATAGQARLTLATAAYRSRAPPIG